MAVLVVFKWRGDPDELIAAYDESMRTEAAREQPKRISHVAARADDGMVVADVWESAEDFQAMYGDPSFQSNIARPGIPDPYLIQVCEIHNTVP